MSVHLTKTTAQPSSPLITQSNEPNNSDNNPIQSETNLTQQTFIAALADLKVTLKALLEENASLRQQIIQLSTMHEETARGQTELLCRLSNTLNVTQKELNANIESVSKLKEKINTLSRLYNNHTHTFTIHKQKIYQGTFRPEGNHQIHSSL